MKNQAHDQQVLGVPIGCQIFQIGRRKRLYLPDLASQHHLQSSADGSPTFKSSKTTNFMTKRISKFGKKADSFANVVREHVRLGTKITETVKSKLSLEFRGQHSSSRWSGECF